MSWIWAAVAFVLTWLALDAIEAVTGRGMEVAVAMLAICIFAIVVLS